MAGILIVEDESIISMNAEMFLTAEGHNVVGICKQGREALEFLETHSPPDLVLMDIALKGDLSGIETTRIINERYNVPVVYMTAHSDESTLRQVRDTAHVGMLRKPFSMDDLNRILKQIAA